MSAGRIASRIVVTATSNESVLNVARRMEENNVGCVIVVSEGRKPLGIVTDRDIVTRAVAQELQPAETPVSVIMSSDVRTIDESTPIEQAIATMAEAAARRLVVTGEESKVAGVLSVDDVMQLLSEETQNIGQLLRKEAPTLQATG